MDASEFVIGYVAASRPLSAVHGFAWELCGVQWSLVFLMVDGAVA